jgi:hypothetical protein
MSTAMPRGVEFTHCRRRAMLHCPPMGPRWIGIRVSAGFSILGSLLVLLLPIALLGVAFFEPPSAESGPIPLKALAVLMTVMFAALSAWGIATGVGIFRRAPWARISTVVFAALLTVMGLCCLVAMVLIPFPANTGDRQVDPRMLGFVRIGIAIFYGLLAVLGAAWLVLFNSAKTKQYFAQAAEVQPGAGSARPLSVTAIAWYLLICAGLTALAGVLRMPATMFGWVALGWAAVAIDFVFVAVQIYLGTGLLQLDENARVWSIIYFCFIAANTVVTAVMPGFAARMDRVMAAMPHWMQSQSAMQIPWDRLPWLSVAGVAIVAVPIWFLVRRRSAFQTDVR